MSRNKLVGIIGACAIAVVVVVILVIPRLQQTPTPKYTLTVVVSPSGAGSVSPSGGKYESGRQVTLAAGPASGYTFDHWSGSESGILPSITVVMYGDKTITANFRAGTNYNPEAAWNKTFGGSSDDEAYSVQQTADGGYIIAGWTNSSGAGSDDVWLIKTDSSGSMAWNQTFGGSSDDEAYSVQQTADGGYIIGGYTESYGAGDADVWLIKTDSAGNMEYNKTFGGSGYDEARSVQQTADGGYIIAGRTGSYESVYGDVWLIKADSSGNLAWDKAFAFGEYSEEEAHSVQQTADGGYIVAGWTRDIGLGYNDVWLIKTDSSGNLAWNRTFGGSGYDEGESIQQTSDGGYIIAGWTMYFETGNSNVYLIKTDSSGNVTWNKIFGDSWADYGRSMQQTSDGGYIVAGWKGSTPIDDDVWMIKTDASGNMEWNKTFGGSNTDWSQSVRQTSDGGYVIAGYTWSYGAGGSDVWLIKVTP